VLAWVYAIARHVRADHFRKSYRIRSREESIGGREDLPQPATGRAADVADLESLLHPLPQSQREVIFLLKICGLSLEEVARATSSSVGSVKQKAHRAYQTLRKTLTGKEAGGAG
jgi:RNA polymerase sigma-70 factor (ECF subfamily)